MYKKISMRKNLVRIINIKLSRLSDWSFCLTRSSKGRIINDMLGQSVHSLSWLTYLTSSIISKQKSNILDIIGLGMLIITFYLGFWISCAVSVECYNGYTGVVNEFTNQ